MSVQYLKGVGPARARQLARLGIGDIEDLVTFFPREYVFLNPCDIGSLPARAGELVVIRGLVAGPPQLRSKGRLAILRVVVADKTGAVDCLWFSQQSRGRPGILPRLAGQLARATRLTLVGKYSREYNNFTVQDYGVGNTEIALIQPKYRLTEGLTNQVLARIIATALAEHRFVDPLPEGFRRSQHLVELDWAYRQAHQPTSRAELDRALYRLKFDELFLYQLSFKYWRRLKTHRRGIVHCPPEDLPARLETAFGFAFTADQRQAFAECAGDMVRPVPMNRLLQGDVGCGKTAVATYALLASALSGYKAVLMAPTEILARQHFQTIARVAAEFSVPVELLTAATNAADRRRIAAMASGSNNLILVGTHALFQEQIFIPSLSLVVTDEQHRFGVRQRLALAAKGENVDILAMSATPIPRTLAMTLYGDMDISIIATKPGGRKEVKTWVVDSAQRPKVFAFIAKEMARGNCGYIICPLVEESEKLAAQSLERYQKVLANALPSWCRYNVLHGKMGADEKEAVVAAFKGGKIHLLLATTVVEVGVDAGNATFIVVENSERFGLAQLHQLRGRVGRRDKQGYCFLLTDTDSQRLKVMEQTNDGFAISRADLALRGAGQFLGERQHGLNEFKLVDIVADEEIVKKSRAAAEVVVEELVYPQWRPAYDIVLKKIEKLQS